ncbi:MAG TPA: DUF692 domain-containing protein [Coxiellaceae bacterium]|nr:DUF692 domain-containing protein [Coxiellaceae bacterium]
MRFGLGLRAEYYESILQEKLALDWFEVISEDYLVEGGSPLYYLDKIRQDYPVSMHGVSLSIGSTDPLNWEYLKQLKALAQRINPLWISDHLCWTGVDGINTHDLLPLPYTEEALKHVVARVQTVQDFLGEALVLENVSSYVSYESSEMNEFEFFVQVAQQSGCLILLDINNVYVSAFNHDFLPDDYLNKIPVEKVRQFHLAGHRSYQNYLIDTHDAPIRSEVWDLYAKAVRRFGKVATSIERDDNIPPLGELLLELDQARKIAERNLTLSVEVA